MEECPFTPDTWEKLSQNRLTAECTEALKKHLGEGCLNCKSFFDKLDLEEFHETVKVQASALSDVLTERHEPNRKERETLFKEIFTNVQREKPAKHFSMEWIPLAAAFILIPIVLFSINYVKNVPSSNRIKGAPSEVPSIVLKVAVLKKQKNVLERGVSGEEYSKEDVLFFRYEVKVRCYVYILRTDGRNMEILHPPDPSAHLIQDMGVYEFREDGSAQGLPLTGLMGRQIFIAVASRKPLDVRREVGPAVLKHMDNETRPSSKEWGLDIFFITVTDRN